MQGQFSEDRPGNRRCDPRRADPETRFSLLFSFEITTYQFDKHFRLRLLEQFDSSQRQLLTDLLAMYEVVPGTVFHAGYGSLYEKDLGPPGAIPHYMTIRRGLFFKASYLHRF